MARTCWTTAVLGLSLAWAVPAQAGIYSTTEPSEGTLNPDFRRFRQTLVTFRNLGIPPAPGVPHAPNPLNKRYLLVGALAARGLPADLTAEERLNLGAALIRLRKYDDAIQVMQPAAIRERDNFLLLANLATAQYQAGQEQRALLSVDQALASWPADWAKLNPDRRQFLMQMGWNEGPFTWYRQAERYFQKLLRLRARESLRGGGQRNNLPEGVDALFDDGKSPPGPLRFQGDSGKYEPAKLAKVERDKLPRDALQIVQQLLVWLPDDVRLYWLLGELYNAQGDAATALDIFNDIVTKGGRFAELREHRLILQSYPRPPARVGMGLEPRSPSNPPAAPDPEDKNANWTPSPWQTLGVGFLGGLIVAFLGYWQVREFGRRRQHRALVPKS